MRKGKKAKTNISPPPPQAGRDRQAKPRAGGGPGSVGRGRATGPASPERALRRGLGVVDIQGLAAIKDHEAISLAFGKDQVYGTLRRTHSYLTHISRVMRNLCPKSEADVPEGTSPVELVRRINSAISSCDEKLLHTEGIGLYYDSDRARWDLMVRDPKFDGLCRIFDCSFLEHLRIADLHLYDIIVATLSNVWKKIRIPTWADLLDQILEMMENDTEAWEPTNEDEETEQENSREIVARNTEPFRTGAPRRCLNAVYHTHKRLPWPKLKRVVDAYNFNTPQKQKVLEWYRAAEKLCKTVKHDFLYYSDTSLAGNTDLGEFVPTHELYGMYWSDGGPVDYQFEEYMNNQLGNFEPLPMLYHLNAETPLNKIRTQDGDLRLIDDWMVQSCQVMDYQFMRTYFGGQRAHKRWVKEVYEPIVTKPKSPLLMDVLLGENINVY
jgi:hypothetical protein